MRISVFRQLMAEEFGEVRAEMIAQNHVLSALDGHTADQALDEGVPARQIWHALCDYFEVPESRR